MIISKGYAEKLIRNGDAEIVTGIVENESDYYIVIDNIKMGRTDHYRVTPAQFALRYAQLNPDA